MLARFNTVRLGTDQNCVWREGGEREGGEVMMYMQGVCYVCIYIYCCSAQTGQYEPCKVECYPVWVLQQICWISLGKRHGRIV